MAPRPPPPRPPPLVPNATDADDPPIAGESGASLTGGGGGAGGWVWPIAVLLATIAIGAVVCVVRRRCASKRTGLGSVQRARTMATPLPSVLGDRQGLQSVSSSACLMTRSSVELRELYSPPGGMQDGGGWGLSMSNLGAAAASEGGTQQQQPAPPTLGARRPSGRCKRLSRAKTGCGSESAAHSEAGGGLTHEPVVVNAPFPDLEGPIVATLDANRQIVAISGQQPATVHDAFDKEDFDEKTRI